MKEHKNFGRQSILFAALFLMLVGGVLYYQAYRLNIDANKKINIYLQENTTQQASALLGRLREQLMGLSTLASYIGARSTFNQQQCVALLKNRSVSKNYKRLGVILPDGTAVHTDQSPLQPNQRQIFMRALQGRASISTPLPDDTDGSMITMMAAPIYHENKVVGVLAAHFPGNFFQPQARSPLLGGKVISFVIDMHGFVLDKSFSPMPREETNLLLHMSKCAFHFSKTPQEIADDLRAGRSGVETFSNVSGQQHMAYVPVGEAGWYLVTLLPEKALGDLRQEIELASQVSLAFGLAGLLLLMPALFLLFTTRRTTQKSISKSTQRLAAVVECTQGGFLCCTGDRNMHILEISPGLLRLLGYDPEEVDDLLRTSYLQCVVEHDRACLISVVGSLGGNPVSTEYRLQRKDGSSLWVRDKRRPATEDGTLVWYCVITDSSERMHILEQQSIFKERLEKMLEVTSDMLFDHNLKSGSIIVSPQLSNRFNVHEAPFSLAPCDAFSQIHIEDQHNYESLRQRLMGGASSQEAQLRLRDINGVYHWQLLRLRSVMDRQNNCAHVVGCVGAVPGEGNIQHSSDDLRHDKLTGLLTQESLRGRINTYAAHGGRDSQAVLCLVDVDGFRGLKTAYGMEATDKLVLELSKAMRGIFRPTDILGRIGYDQFPIFMRDLEDRQLLLSRLEELTNYVSKGLELGNKRIAYSVSIGLAFFPENGRNFERLLHQADLALNMAKEKSKQRDAGM